MVFMFRKKRGVKLFQQINGLKVIVKTSERKQFSGTPCRFSKYAKDQSKTVFLSLQDYFKIA